jgi:hypothetical protein
MRLILDRFKTIRNRPYYQRFRIGIELSVILGLMVFTYLIISIFLS